MTGRLEYARGCWGRAEEKEVYGLRVLLSRTDPDGLLGEGRLRRAGRALRRGGAGRLLVPADFPQWALMERYGLSPVDPGPLVRAQGAPLALEALRRRGLEPGRATVALRGSRAGPEMRRAAARLVGRVRNLVIDAPRGGEELAGWLRWEYGVPVLPGGEGGELALRFDPGGALREEAALELYGPVPGLGGLVLSAPELREEDRGDLALLTVLWEGGRLGERDIKIT